MSREGSLSCHTHYDMGPWSIWSHSKACPDVSFCDKPGVLQAYSNPDSQGRIEVIIEMNGPNINSWFKNSQRSQHIFGVVKGHIIIFSEVRGHSFFYNGQISLSVFTAIKSLVNNKGLRYIYLILMVLVHVPFMIFYRKSWTWNNLNILI